MLRAICAIVCLASLAACGLRGPLYLPPHRDAPRPLEQQPAKDHPAHDSPIEVAPTTSLEVPGPAAGEAREAEQPAESQPRENVFIIEESGTIPGF